MGRVLVALVAVLFVALSGCSGSGTPSSAEPTDDTSTSVTTPTGPAGATDLPLAPAERLIQYNLSADNTLTTGPPSAGTFNAGVPATGFATGIATVDFQSAPFPNGALVQAQPFTVALYFQTPLVSNSVFDVAAWFGSTKANVASEFTTHDAFVAPGEPHRIELTLEFSGTADLYVPAGESLELLIAGGFTRETGNAILMVGPETPSGFALEVLEFMADPFADLPAAAEQAFEGTLAHGVNPANCDPAPGVTSMVHTFTIPEGTRYATVRSELGSPVAPGSDIDLRLSAGGTLIAATSTPSPDEGMVLALTGLDGIVGKSLELTVYACGNGAVPYVLTVTTA